MTAAEIQDAGGARDGRPEPSSPSAEIAGAEPHLSQANSAMGVGQRVATAPEDDAAKTTVAGLLQAASRETQPVDENVAKGERSDLERSDILKATAAAVLGTSAESERRKEPSSTTRDALEASAKTVIEAAANDVLMDAAATTELPDGASGAESGSAPTHGAISDKDARPLERAGLSSPEQTLNRSQAAAEEQFTRKPSFATTGAERRARKLAAMDLLYGTAVSAASRPSTAPAGRPRRNSASSAMTTSTRLSTAANGAQRRASIQSSRERLSRTNAPARMRRGKSNPTMAKEDDEKNCTFQPKINKSSQSMIRGSGPFLKRFETAHESKVQAMETRRAKAEYDARVDKKTCPSCAAEQSYDECRSHKNKCRNCKQAFRHKVLWEDVKDRFLDRVESKMSEREEKRAEIEAKTAPSFHIPEKTVYDPDYGVSRTLRPAPQRWEHVQADFMRRMENDARRRDAKRLLAERDAALNAGCTFSPRLEAGAYRRSDFEPSLTDDTFEERMARDAARRQREKMQNDLRARYRAPVSPTAPLVTKPRAAWDDLSDSFVGGQRRNPSGRWV